MKYKFIKTLIISLIFSSLNIAWFWGEKEESPEQRLQNINEAVKLSRNHLTEGNPEVAIDVLQKAYRKYGETLSLCEALAYAFSQSGEYASSAIYFEKAFKLSGENVILLLNAGRAYQECNAINSALSLYERYLNVNPKDASIWKEIAILQEKQKLYQKALNSYMSFIKNVGRNPNTTEACEIAKLFLKSKNISQAKAWFESALGACRAENVEVKSEILAGLIDIYLVESDMTNLEKYYLLLKETNPTFLEENYPQLKEQIETYKAKLEEAKNALIEAQKLEEEAKIQEEKRLEEEAKAQEEKEAQEFKEKRLEAIAKEEEEKEKVAQEEAKQKAEDEALAKESAKIRALLDPQQAKEEKPIATEKSTIEEAETENAESSESSEKTESTEEKAQELIDVETSELSLQIYEAKKLLEDGEFSKAENLAQTLVAENPNSSRAWAVLAEAYMAQSMSIDAFLAAKQALARDKGNIRYVLLKIKIGALVDGEGSLFDNLLQADRDFPECPEILLALARISNNEGNISRAKAYYSLFLDIASKKNALYKDAQDESDSLEEGKKLEFSMEQIIKDLEV